jgi:hypothetical protein
MTNIDVKTVGELFKPASPINEHQQKLGQTLPGGLSGQAVVPVDVVVLHRVSRRASIVKRNSGADRRPSRK